MACIELIDNDSNLSFSLSELPWDIRALGYPVFELTNLVKLDDDVSVSCFSNLLEKYLDNHNQYMISTRLQRESRSTLDYLTKCGFSLIESSASPRILLNSEFVNHPQVEILLSSKNVNFFADLASRSFVQDRFHIDSRILNESADKRFYHWVHDGKSRGFEFLEILIDGSLGGFFMIEKQGKTYYWHLTALDSSFQGKGWGYKVWESVLAFLYKNGAEAVESRITLENIPVLNVYSRLGASFSDMYYTLHYHSIR